MISMARCCSLRSLILVACADDRDTCLDRFLKEHWGDFGVFADHMTRGDLEARNVEL